MTNIDKARQYLDAWNARDAEAIFATLTPGGTYTDPSTGTISGTAIGDSARRLWASFPDLILRS